MNCKVVLVSAGMNESFILKPGVTTIGREADNDIQLTSENVSRYHAKFDNLPNVCDIEDMNSSNGTFVNGDRGKSFVLKNGDEIRLGDVRLRFEECASEESEDVMTGTRDYSNRAQQHTVRMTHHPDESPQGADAKPKPPRPLRPLRPQS